MPIVLRPYQTDLIASIAAEYVRGARRVLAVASTGAGKTRCFAAITERAMNKGKRVTIAAHRIEIVEQISRALDDLGVRHGRIQPGHTLTDDAVQAGMIQTLARRLDRVPQPDLLVFDECHHVVTGSYVRVMEAWTRARILGVTATPQRLDGRGLGEAFDVMIEAIPMADLIAQGFLAGYEYLAPPARADLSRVSRRLGDYAIDELAAVMDKATVTGDAVQHYRRYLDRRPAIAFCVTVAHAEHVAQQFSEAGYRAASVDGAMAAAERRDRIAAIGDGRLDVLTSCELISEGTDVPAVAGALLLRPTQSLSMFLQQCGRVLRPKPDGSRAIILDHVGNVHRHGMPDAPRIWSLDAKPKRKQDTAVSVSTCKACYKAFAVTPNWKDGHEPCADEPKCLFAQQAGTGRAQPEIVAGELEAFTAERLAAIRATPLRDLLTGRETRAELEQIRQAKGYAKGWTWHILQERRQKAAA